MKSRIYLGIAVATYFIFIIMSVIYYKERVIIWDASFQLFSMLAHHSFAIQVNRFGAVVTQIFPVITDMLHGSLHTVMLSYSLSFPIYYFISFLLVWFILKNPKMALVILLFNTLITTHSFFWIQCEIVQGIVFTLIYLAFVENQLKKEKASTLFWWLSPFMLIVILFFHPLLPFVLLFGLGYLFLQYKPQGKWLIIIGLGFVVLYGLKTLLFKNAYDSQAMSKLHYLITIFPNYINIKGNKDFIQWVIRDYYGLPLLLSAISVFYLTQKEYLKFSFLLTSFIVVLAIINITNYEGKAQQFYLEPHYSILSVFVSLPFVYELLPRLKPLAGMSAILAIVALCFIRIYDTSKQYSERLNWYREILKTTNGKLIMNEHDVPLPLLKMSWSATYEFWALSTLEQHQTRSIIIEEKPHEFDWANNSSNQFITKWGVFTYSELPSQYFVFTDTVSRYKIYRQ